jgi:hypothetical protein
MIDVVPLRYGTAFKRAFGDPKVFSDFASDVLGIPVQVQAVHQEYAFRETFGKVKVEFDLFAEDPSHRLVVELQHLREGDFFDRLLYYHVIAMAEQVTSHTSYRFARDVYTMVVLTTLPREGRLRFSAATTDFDLVTERGERLGVYRHRLVFLNPRAVSAETPPALRAWLEVIEDSLDGVVDETRVDARRRPVLEAIRTERLTPEEHARLKDEAAWEEVKADARTEGRREGSLAGRGEALRALARAAGIALSAEDEARIDGCTDAATLDHWITNGRAARDAGELFC